MKLCHKRRSHHPVRLFWLILRSFILVIVLGLSGMFAIFGFTMHNLERMTAPPDKTVRIQAAYARLLSDYYQQQGQSWAGLDAYLSDLALAEAGFFPIDAVLDQQGHVVARSGWYRDADQLPGKSRHTRPVPIVVDGTQVGSMLMFDAGAFRRPNGGPLALLGLLPGMAVLGGILMLLAVGVAQRLSRPLAHLRDAVQAMAAGDLSVQVPGARVRELNDLADAFNRTAHALARADRQRRQMTADVAHELRTPLSVIRGRLEGMQDGVYPANPEQIARLLHETALLERLIEDLRLLALAEAGQLPLYLEEIDPDTLLAATATTFAEQAAQQQIDLIVEESEQCGLVRVDPQRMEQVLGNLVSNALRYTPAGGRITLSSEWIRSADNTAVGQVVLRVRDTGAGIAPDELPYIFDRFWKADRARLRGGSGSGLGLAIARQFVLAQGGSIHAASTPGEGTTISIML